MHIRILLWCSEVETSYCINRTCVWHEPHLRTVLKPTALQSIWILSLQHLLDLLDSFFFLGILTKTPDYCHDTFGLHAVPTRENCIFKLCWWKRSVTRFWWSEYSSCVYSRHWWNWNINRCCIFNIFAAKSKCIQNH